MEVIQELMQIVIEESQVLLGKTDHPVRHVLSGDGKPIAFKRKRFIIARIADLQLL